MASKNELRPLDVILAEVRKNTEDTIKNNEVHQRKSCEKTCAKIEKNRQALALLDAAGYDLTLYQWSTGENYTLELGHFSRTASGNWELAQALRKLCTTLDSGIQSEDDGYKCADDSSEGRKKNWVKITREVKEFPGIKVSYTRPLKAGLKCKIKTITSTYRSLVCDNE